ncbi:MAG TPA: hypothetical protein VHM19_04130, partial [Polyangiales bacterium]|nr:hypothetical protein [Polyangiales bacterium]
MTSVRGSARSSLTALLLGLALGAAVVCSWGARAHAQEGSLLPTEREKAQARAQQAKAQKRPPALAGYLGALRDKHLVQADTAKVEELRATLAKAEALALQGRHEDAVVLLYELVESPRFADYAELEEMDAARQTLGSSLHALGAEESARKYLRQVLDKGPDGRYFAPAFRAHTDVVLAGLDL